MSAAEDGQRDGQERPEAGQGHRADASEPRCVAHRDRTVQPVAAGRSADGRDLGRAHGPRALVVDRLDRADHQLDAEAVVDEVVAGPPERVRVGVVGQQPDDRGGQRRRRRAAGRGAR